MAEEMLDSILDWCFKNTNILRAKDFSDNGKGLIHFASEKGYSLIITKLLAKGVEVDRKDNLGCTPLHLAASNGQIDVAKLLLENGSDVNCHTNSNQSEKAFRPFKRSPSLN